MSNGSRFIAVVSVAAVCGSVFAQERAEIGVRADYPVHGPILHTDFVSYCSAPGVDVFCGIFESSVRHPAIGISASVLLGSHIRVRFDPVYQRVGFSWSAYSRVTNLPGDPFYVVAGKNATTANRWVVPVLAEREMWRHVRVGIGPAVSTLTTNRTVWEVRSPVTGYQRIPTTLTGGVRRTIVGGAGAVEFPFRVGRFVAAPEIRYTRWGAKHYGGYSAMDEVSVGVAIRR